MKVTLVDLVAQYNNIKDEMRIDTLFEDEDDDASV